MIEDVSILPSAFGPTGPAVNQATFIHNAATESFGKPLSHLTQTWVLDSGATDHVACSLSLFSSYYIVRDSFVPLPNKLRIPVTHKCTIHLSSRIIL